MCRIVYTAVLEKSVKQQNNSTEDAYLAIFSQKPNPNFVNRNCSKHVKLSRRAAHLAYDADNLWTSKLISTASDRARLSPPSEPT